MNESTSGAIQAASEAQTALLTKLEERGLDLAQFRVLQQMIFPEAKTTEAILLAVDYCRTRGLDVMKRPVHVVPVWSTKRGKMVETIWPGISEIRTTAMRSNAYAGRDATEWGPDISIELEGVEYVVPEWARVTVYRMVQGTRCAFVGPQVWWVEAYGRAGRKNLAPNDMWAKRRRGQLEKVAEASALRQAFPEEVAGMIGAEEVNPFGQIEPDDGAAIPAARSERLRRAAAAAGLGDHAVDVEFRDHDGEAEPEPADPTVLDDGGIADQDIPE